MTIMKKLLPLFIPVPSTFPLGHRGQTNVPGTMNVVESARGVLGEAKRDPEVDEALRWLILG